MFWCAQIDGERVEEFVQNVGAEARVLASQDQISQKVFIKSFCKSQFPHKSVNSSFIIANVINKLTFVAEFV